MLEITLPTNDAVLAITEIILFAVVRWKSASLFFCGELTRHPDEKMKLQEQKNKIKALETPATKLEQEVRSREAAFDRVQGCVTKQLEDMLLKEYPEKYVQNNARNLLKIQEDIAFLKKSLKGSGPPRRETWESVILPSMVLSRKLIVIRVYSLQWSNT